jgi:CheY-like chemotaxis protein
MSAINLVLVAGFSLCPPVGRWADRSLPMERNPMPVTVLFEVRLLVAEDDADLIDCIRRVLSRSFRVTACRSARAALSLVAEGKFFDVLICGYEMLEMSGRDLHSAIADLDPVLARNTLVIVSGRLAPTDEQYFEGRRVRLLYSPFRSERLREDIEVLATRAMLALHRVEQSVVQ